MDEDEINEWYEEEKENALEEFQNKITVNKKDPIAEEEFLKRMKEIKDKYKEQMMDLINRKKPKSGLEKFLDKENKKGKGINILSYISMIIEKLNFMSKK